MQPFTDEGDSISSGRRPRRPPCLQGGPHLIRKVLSCEQSAKCRALGCYKGVQGFSGYMYWKMHLYVRRSGVLGYEIITIRL